MGPEKRLPLALFTCFVVIVGLQLFNAPAQVSDEDRAALEQQLAGEESLAPVVPPSVSTGEDAPEQPAVDSWDDSLTFGAPGDPGYMPVHFDSYGGSVSEIRLGNHFTRVGFDEADEAIFGGAMLVPRCPIVLKLPSKKAAAKGSAKEGKQQAQDEEEADYEPPQADEANE